MSKSPVLLGIGIFLAYLGASTFGGVSLPMLLAGMLPLAAAFVYWIREDVRYWHEGRTDPGVLPGKDVDWFGMVFFLATEVMLFGGLFAVFFTARANNPELWHEMAADFKHSLPLVGLNTVFLLSSSVTLEIGERQLRKGNRRGFIGWLVATIVLGAVFLGVQVKEYSGFIAEDITLSGSPFGSIFYQLTGTHGFHVFLGLIMLIILLVRALVGQFDAKRHVAVEAFSLYWHFVDVVWIFVFTIVYLGTSFMPPGVA